MDYTKKQLEYVNTIKEEADYVFEEINPSSSKSIKIEGDSQA